MDYPVVLERDDNKTILVSFPDFPEAHTFGDTETEALARAEDALATVVDAYIADRRSIPQPSAIIAKHYVTMPALMEAKIALYTSMRRAHVTKAELGRRLKLHPPQVDRLLAMHHGSRLDQIEKALRVLGQRLVVGVEAHSEPRRQLRRRIRVGGTRSRAAASDGNR
ncbi:MAG TPA: type II toxin-antitoxin system HicB family antitoxin [Vicinamibacterales bacterium]|nr:type II toxin-antitoxin system HicB family antitoxin [Vicinamibacterales bacterium]